MCLTADPEVVSSIPARSHTFVEIDYEMVSTTILLPSADSRMVVVSYKRKYVQEVPVNRSVKLAQNPRINTEGFWPLSKKDWCVCVCVGGGGG